MAGKFSLEAIFKAVDRLTRPIDKMQARVRRFTESAEKGMRSVDNVTGKTLSGLGKLSAAMAIAGTVAAGSLALAAKPGIDFEQQMANLGATSLQTRDQIQDLEKEALRLGAATQFSATEVGAAMEVMAKAGFENEEILKGVGGMIYAAAAAGEDLASTTEHVSSVMKGMGLATAESARVADVLALASVRTNSSIGSLAESMSKVSSTARQLKVPLNDTVAMVALLQDVGLDASEAGSATATMLTRMAKPTDAIAAKMRAMGVSFQDAKGDMLAPAKVLGQLVKAGKKAGGNMKQIAFFADLVGLRGQKAALNLKDLFASGKVTALVDELDHAQGTAEKMSGLRMNTFTGDLDVAVENVKGLSISLFALASGPLRKILQGFSEWLSKNQALIVSGIVDFIKSVADNLPTIVKWLERIGKAAAVWYAYAAAVKVATVAIAAFNAIMAMSPMGLLVTALVAAAALIVAFWPEISAFFQDVWSGIADLSARIWDGTKALASRIGSAVMGALKAVWTPIANFLTAAFELYVGMWSLVLAPVLFLLRPVFDAFRALAQFIMDNWEPIKAFFSSIWDGIKVGALAVFGVISSVASTSLDMLKAVWNPIVDYYKGLWEAVVAVVRFEWDLIKSVVKGVFDFAVAHVERVLGLIARAVNAVREVGRGNISALFGGGDSTPQVVSPSERAATSITESGSLTGSGEITIRDQSGRAEVSKRPARGDWFSLNLQRTGAF